MRETMGVQQRYKLFVRHNMKVCVKVRSKMRLDPELHRSKILSQYWSQCVRV